MLAFLVGLFVIAMIGIASVIGVLLIPFLLVLGIFLRFFLGLIFCLFFIWLIGKATLMLIASLRKPSNQV